jgi:hypothetical protein
MDALGANRFLPRVMSLSTVKSRATARSLPTVSVVPIETEAPTVRVEATVAFRVVNVRALRLVRVPPLAVMDDPRRVE